MVNEYSQEIPLPAPQVKAEFFLFCFVFNKASVLFKPQVLILTSQLRAMATAPYKLHNALREKNRNHIFFLFSPRFWPLKFILTW